MFQQTRKVFRFQGMFPQIEIAAITTDEQRERKDLRKFFTLNLEIRHVIPRTRTVG